MASTVNESFVGTGHIRDVVLNVTADASGNIADYPITSTFKFIAGARVIWFALQPGTRTSPSASASSSLSPSISASSSTSASPSPTPSQSPSASVSPSSSISPSSSTSISPSSSRSPSVSASSSASPSLSPSVSISPSSSISPSASVSPSIGFPGGATLDVEVLDEFRQDVLQGLAMHADRVRGALGPVFYASAPAMYPTVAGWSRLVLHSSNIGANETLTLTLRFALGA